MVGENFKIYCVKITGKRMCKPKNWKLTPLLVAPGKTLTGSYHHPQAEGNYPYPPNSIFVKIYFLPSREEETYFYCWHGNGKRLSRPWSHWDLLTRRIMDLKSSTSTITPMLLKNLLSVDMDLREHYLFLFEIEDKFFLTISVSQVQKVSQFSIHILK